MLSAAPSFPRTDGQRVAWALLLMVGLAALFIATVVGLQGSLGSGPARLIAAALAVSLGVVGLRRGGATWAGLGLRRDGLGQAILRGLLGTVAIGGALTVLLFARGGPEAVSAALIEPSLAERVPFLLIGLTASVLEEPIFRGYLQPAAMRRFGGTRGLLGTALLFAIVHGKALRWPPDALIGKLVIGLGLGILRGREQHLAAPLLAHALIWFVFGLA